MNMCNSITISELFRGAKQAGISHVSISANTRGRYFTRHTDKDMSAQDLCNGPESFV